MRVVNMHVLYIKSHAMHKSIIITSIHVSFTHLRRMGHTSILSQVL
jgi:hypothetical protein